MTIWIDCKKLCIILNKKDGEQTKSVSKNNTFSTDILSHLNLDFSDAEFLTPLSNTHFLYKSL